MDFCKNILEIVEIIAKNSTGKNKVLEITKKCLDYYNSNRYVENIEEIVWDYIVDLALIGYDDFDDEDFQIDIEIDDDYFFNYPVSSFDWKDEPVTYIEELEDLLQDKGIKSNILDIEIDEDDFIPEVSVKIYEKLKKEGYILADIGLMSDSYDVFIVEEKDFIKIRNIIEKDEVLAEIIFIKEFNTTEI